MHVSARELTRLMACDRWNNPAILSQNRSILWHHGYRCRSMGHKG